MSKRGDKDFDELRHDYAKRTAKDREESDRKYGVPAMDKVKSAFQPKPQEDGS